MRLSRTLVVTAAGLLAVGGLSVAGLASRGDSPRSVPAAHLGYGSPETFLPDLHSRPLAGIGGAGAFIPAAIGAGGPLADVGGSGAFIPAVHTGAGSSVGIGGAGAFTRASDAGR